MLPRFAASGVGARPNTGEGLKILSGSTQGGWTIRNAGNTATYFQNYWDVSASKMVFYCSDEAMNISSTGMSINRNILPIYDASTSIGSSGARWKDLFLSGSATSTQFKLSALNTAPASAAATGVLGEIRIDASYIYVCTATNTWKRAALTTW